MLKVERNNAMDELALAQANFEQLRMQGKAKDEYWRQWTEGANAKADWWAALWRRLSIR